jgi:hypothetical protein
MGCQLCHQTSGGGTELNTFGSLLVSTYGLSNNASAEDDPSLEQALALLKQQDPDAVTDLENGLNPNDDPSVFAGALPTPTYGCSAATRAGRVRAAAPVTASLAALALCALVRRRRRA